MNSTELLNCCLEFHDSRADSVTTTDGSVSVVFTSAYLHKSEGMPGVDAGTGWTQAATLEFSSARVSGAHDIGDGRIMDRSLEVNGEQRLTGIPIPFDVSRMVKGTFGFSNGTVIVIEAARAHLALWGNPTFVGTFPPR